MHIKKKLIEFKKIPDDMKTEKVCLTAVKNNPNNFKYVPDNLKTHKIVDTAISYNTYNFNYVPNNLKYVPDNLKTPKLCESVVKYIIYVNHPNCSGYLNFIPDRYISNKIISMILKKSKSGIFISGKFFVALFADKHFIKLTNREEIHNQFKFTDGLNTDTRLIYSGNDDGGIYFIDANNKNKWLEYGNKIMYYERDVTIPDNAIIYMINDNYKTNKFILGEKRLI